MKKVIREDVFDSNSSSNHSMVMQNQMDMHVPKAYHYIQPDGYFHVTCGEFGWSGECTTFMDKLEYALTMVWETEVHGFNKWNVTYEEGIDALTHTDGFETINQLIRNEYHCNGLWVHGLNGYYPFGYIDHQSTEGYHSLQDFLDDYGVTLERFLFDKNVWMNIDNDNH